MCVTLSTLANLNERVDAAIFVEAVPVNDVEKLLGQCVLQPR